MADECPYPGPVTTVGQCQVWPGDLVPDQCFTVWNQDKTPTPDVTTITWLEDGECSESPSRSRAQLENLGSAWYVRYHMGGPGDHIVPLSWSDMQRLGLFFFENDQVEFFLVNDGNAVYRKTINGTLTCTQEM